MARLIEEPNHRARPDAQKVRRKERLTVDRNPKFLEGLF